ncbi:hypothetical protein PsAD14_02788 [Pseudovibrio sp. Ad14]|nr:hypothetical protein PsW74_04302 [Pseudovibrio sp. W74]KZL08843.1 hypothetical protein PsAD14_02788 [Pseudovibrio sp. Ad14]
MRTETFNFLIFIVFIGVLIGIPFVYGVLSLDVIMSIFDMNLQTFAGLSGIIISLTTLFFVLYQIRIARDDSDLLKFTIAADFLDFLYQQQALIQKIEDDLYHIRVLKSYHDDEQTLISECNAYSAMALEEKLGDDLVKTRDTIVASRSSARKYLTKIGLKRFDEVLSFCQMMSALKHYDWLSEIPYPIKKHEDNFIIAVRTYETGICKMIAGLEPQKQKAFDQIFERSNTKK